MKQVTLGPKYEIRLSHLKPWHVLGVKCFQCDRTSILWPATLRKRFRDHTKIDELEPRLKCTRCGNKTFNSWSVMQLDRHD